jgi:hypothetical protein
MKMRSMMEILNLVIDRHITTKQQAAAMVNEEAQAIMEHYHISAEEAKARLLGNIGYVTGYLSHAQADLVMELFDTAHPVFGRTHPSAEEAYRLGREYAERSKKGEHDDPTNKI